MAETFTERDVKDLYEGSNLFRSLLDHPEHGQDIKRVLTNDFGVPLAEVQVEDRVQKRFQEPMGKLEKQIVELTEKLKERDLREEVQGHRKKLRDIGLSDDELKEVEELMQEKRIPDYETAHELLRYRRQSMKPHGAIDDGRMDVKSGEQMEKVWKEPRNNKARLIEALAEFRSMHPKR